MDYPKYEAPDTIAAAVKLLSGKGTDVHILAGGTDLLVKMHSDVIAPNVVVDIKKIAELRTIKKEAAGYRIGAAVPGMTLVDNRDFAKTWPGVIDGVKLIGSIQIKGRATLGGN